MPFDSLSLRHSHLFFSTLEVKLSIIPKRLFLQLFNIILFSVLDEANGGSGFFVLFCFLFCLFGFWGFVCLFFRNKRKSLEGLWRDIILPVLFSLSSRNTNMFRSQGSLFSSTHTFLIFMNHVDLNYFFNKQILREKKGRKYGAQLHVTLRYVRIRSTQELNHPYSF